MLYMDRYKKVSTVTSTSDPLLRGQRSKCKSICGKKIKQHPILFGIIASCLDRWALQKSQWWRPGQRSLNWSKGQIHFFNRLKMWTTSDFVRVCCVLSGLMTKTKKSMTTTTSKVSKRSLRVNDLCLHIDWKNYFFKWQN